MQIYYHRLIHQLQTMNLTYRQIGELTLSSEGAVQGWMRKKLCPIKFMSNSWRG